METTTFGEFFVDSIDGNQCQAHSSYDEGISGTFLLPPLSRTDTSQIASGSRFYGVFNTQSGMGALMVALGDADFKGKFEYEISSSVDVKAGSISLKTHTHPITAAQFTGTIDPSTGSAEGTISGNTEQPV